MLEEAAVIEAFERMQKAMISKDIATLNALVADEKTFTHLSGKTQTKEEFFAEIADGTLNYYKYMLHSPRVIVNDGRATLTGRTTLTACVYGISGEWTLPTKVYFVKQDGKWLQTNGPDGDCK